MSHAFIQLHVAIFIAGFTGILGRLIELPEGPLVLYRMFITSTVLFCFLAFRKYSFNIPLREALSIAGVGTLIAIHWIFFYGSIKYANVSISVVCFALVGFFTALLEPIWGRKKISLRELGFSLVTVAGVALIFHFDTRYRIGIILGVFSAFFAALFTISMKRVSRDREATPVLFFQMVGGFVFLLLSTPFYLAAFPEINVTPTSMDVFYLLILSTVCTIGLFSLEIQALRSISAFTANLSFNLEPVYSIVLAMIIFGEAKEVGVSFFVGLFLICVSVLLQSLYAIRQRGGVC